MARSELWKTGKDFGHGTGHGVGYCLNVHEGPFSISKNIGYTVALISTTALFSYIISYYIFSFGNPW